MNGVDWEPQTGSPKNIVGIYLPGSIYSYYIPTMFLGFPVWGSHSTPCKVGKIAHNLQTEPSKAPVLHVLLGLNYKYIPYLPTYP